MREAHAGTLRHGDNASWLSRRITAEVKYDPLGRTAVLSHSHGQSRWGTPHVDGQGHANSATDR